MPTRAASPAEELLRGPIKSKTVFPVLVLHLLESGPDHGFGLMQRIAELCSGILAVNTNTIYPLLRRLEERGFINGEWDHPTKRARRMYSITPGGRERLERIKSNMLPYLEHLAASVAKLRSELYGADPAPEPFALPAVLRASRPAGIRPAVDEDWESGTALGAASRRASSFDGDGFAKRESS